jgi:hypothetical protein
LSSTSDPAERASVPSDRHRRRLAPLLLLAGGLGAYVMVDRDLPHEHEVSYDLGSAAREITGLEVTWSREDAGVEEAALTTRWHFAEGTAPTRVPARVRLPAGAWQVDVGVEKAGKIAAHWSGPINLEATPFWKRVSLKEGPVIVPVREALR